MEIMTFTGKYRFLSNFAPCSIIYNGVIYPSVEHAYQSAKSDSKEWKEICSDAARTPGEIKRLSKKVQLVDGWDEKKVSLMKMLLLRKFLQKPFKQLLLATGDAELQEGNWWRDVFWGIDVKTGKGENILGKLLMEIRKKLENA